MKKYIKECDCREIQELWEPEVGDEFLLGDTIYLVVGGDEDEGTVVSQDGFETNKKDCIFLPSLSWLIELLGNEFHTLDKVEDESKFFAWKREADGEKAFEGSTPELACIKALKAILKEKERGR